MRSGLTLLETLLAVALLALLTAGISGWITSMASMRSTSERHVVWPAHAETAFRLIAEDLMQGDRLIVDESRKPLLPEIDDTRIRIQTRVSGYGKAIVVYEFDEAGNRLTRSIGSDTKEIRRTVLDHVATLEAELIAPADSSEAAEIGASAYSLSITIRSTDDVETRKRFMLRW